jgi:hypothetical protein
MSMGTNSPGPGAYNTKFDTKLPHHRGYSLARANKSQVSKSMALPGPGPADYASSKSEKQIVGAATIAKGGKFRLR